MRSSAVVQFPVHLVKKRRAPLHNEVVQFTPRIRPIHPYGHIELSLMRVGAALAHLSFAIHLAALRVASGDSE